MMIRTLCDIHGISPHLNRRRLWIRFRNNALPYLPALGLALAAAIIRGA